MVIVHSYVSHYQRVIVVTHSAKPQTCVDSASHLRGKNASQSAPRLMTMTSPYMISKKPTCGKIQSWFYVHIYIYYTYMVSCTLYMVFMYVIYGFYDICIYRRIISPSQIRGGNNLYQHTNGGANGMLLAPRWWLLIAGLFAVFFGLLLLSKIRPFRRGIEFPQQQHICFLRSVA